MELAPTPGELLIVVVGTALTARSPASADHATAGNDDADSHRHGE